MKTNVLGIAAAALLLAGCTVGPDYQKPTPAVPGEWTEKGSAVDPATSRVTAQAAVVTEWWKTFGDDELTSLVERAAASNLDLKLAGSRIREARGLRGVSAGAL